MELHQRLACCGELGEQPAFAICQHAIGPSDDGSLPEWIPLVPAGEKIKAFDGRSFSNATPQEVVDAFNADPRDLPLDWEHATEERAPQGLPAPAAAWIDQMEIRGAGEIWGRIKEWTPKGAESIRNKEYRYISPAFLFDKASKIIAKIVSAALVNRPALDMPAIARSLATAAEWTTSYVNDLPDSAFLYVESGGEKDEDGRTVPRSLRHFPYKDASGKIDLPHLRNAIARILQAKIPGLDAAALQRLQAKAQRLLKQAQGETAREDVMDREKLIAELGLAADATDEQILEALAKLKQVKTELQTATAKLAETETELANARSASPSLEQYVPRADYDAVVAREKKMRDEKQADESKAREKQVDDAISAALSEGKIVPASKEQYRAMCSSEDGFKQFQELVKTLPVIGDPSPLDNRPPPAPTGTITAEEKAIAREAGLSDEEYLKQRKEAIAEMSGTA